MRTAITALCGAVFLCTSARFASRRGWERVVPVAPAIQMPAKPAELLVGYLRTRQLITRERPVIRMCGSEAMKLMTTAFRDSLRTRWRLVDSILVESACPNAMIRQRDRTSRALTIKSIVIGTDTSAIEAVAEPFTSPPPYAHGHKERYVHFHPPVQGDITLTFYDFVPSD